MVSIKTYTFTFGGNKKLELDRPNLFLANMKIFAEIEFRI
jgi:hypothetical protein